MCCLSAVLGSTIPRVMVLVWWLADRARWEQVFTHFIWGLVGFLFVPWTTLAYVWVAPGGIRGADFVWLLLGLLIDIGYHAGGVTSLRRR